MPPRQPPRGFRRVVHWQLAELSLLLGSDTVIFRSDEHGRSSLDGSRSSDGYLSPQYPTRRAAPLLVHARAHNDAPSTSPQVPCARLLGRLTRGKLGRHVPRLPRLLARQRPLQCARGRLVPSYRWGGARLSCGTHEPAAERGRHRGGILPRGGH
jgi:hypothetical protein